MPNEKHLKILKQGVHAWNEWRNNNPHTKPHLFDANLVDANLSGANLNRANLSSVNLSSTYLRSARLNRVNLNRANLNRANLNRATADWTVFGHNDLSEVMGLDTLKHRAPSIIGIDTIKRSKGKIPEGFLRGCGLNNLQLEQSKLADPDLTPAQITEIAYKIIELRTDQHPIEFYSCFISYSHMDEEFTKRLHSRMRDENLRVWYAPEDVKAGQKIHEQIDQAIRLHDKVLLVLSENSMASEWVTTEIYKARQREIKDGCRILFPIRLVDFEAIRRWQCFDADTGKDLAREIREYFIPNFQNWKEHDAFEEGFQRLMRDLAADELKQIG